MRAEEKGSGLFRIEALEGQGVALHGELLVAQPLTHRVFAFAAVAIAAAVVLYVCVGSYTSRTRVSGIVAPLRGVIRIVPPFPGTINDQRVLDGDSVRAGQVLFVLADDRSLDVGKKIVDEVARSRLEKQRNLKVERATLFEIAREQEESSNVRASSLISNQKRISAEIDAQSRRIAIAEKGEARLVPLTGKGILPVTLLEEKQDELESLRTQLSVMQRTRADYAQELRTIALDLKRLTLQRDNDVLSIDRELINIDLDLSEFQMRSRYAIVAPSDGIITSITGRRGQLVGSNTIATLIPKDEELVVNLFLPSRSIGFLSMGQEVRLRYQAFPYQKYGQQRGSISDISVSPIDISELPSGLQQTQEALYRVRVQLRKQSLVVNGKQRQLLPGMIVEADIRHERRRIVEWIVDPLRRLEKTLT